MRLLARVVLPLVRTVAFAVHFVAGLILADSDGLVVGVILRLGRWIIRTLRLLLVCGATLGVHRRGHGRRLSLTTFACFCDARTLG